MTCFTDGLTRLTYSEFCALPPGHYQSYVDQALIHDLHAEGLKACRAGFCEWQPSAAHSAISLGWAWYMENIHTPPQLAPGGVGHNIMFRSRSGYDLGHDVTDTLLLGWIADIPWKISVIEHNIGNNMF